MKSATKVNKPSCEMTWWSKRTVSTGFCHLLFFSKTANLLIKAFNVKICVGVGNSLQVNTWPGDVKILKVVMLFSYFDIDERTKQQTRSLLTLISRVFAMCTTVCRFNALGMTSLMVSKPRVTIPHTLACFSLENRNLKLSLSVGTKGRNIDVIGALYTMCVLLGRGSLVYNGA